MALRRVFPAYLALCLFAVLIPTASMADSRLIFPRASFAPDIISGIAIANPTNEEATVTITAFGTDGHPLAGEGVSNPANVTVPAHQQAARVTGSLFGSGIDPATVAWLQATSPVDGLTGFFLLLNSSITLLDGAELPSLSQKLIFNLVRLDGGYDTEIDLVNPAETDADIQIKLSGTSPAPIIKQLSLPGKGVIRLSAAAFFQAESILPSAYVTVDSNQELAGFELVRHGETDGIGLNACPITQQLSTLYFQQPLSPGAGNAQLGVVNYSADPVVLTITATRADGKLYDFKDLRENPVTRALPAGGSLREDVQSMFGFLPSAEGGWLTVKATSAAINGYLSYRDPSTGGEAAVISPAEGRKRALFSHLATTPPFSTGITVLNPSTLPANVRFLAIAPDGRILGSYDTVLRPGQSIQKQLGSQDFIPSAADQLGGMVWIKSDLPLLEFSVIAGGNAIVSIPAQDVPDSFNPDSDLSQLKIVPPIAIVPPAVSQRFQLNGNAAAVWRVNGNAGGSSDDGTISSAGLFTAPNTIPSPQVSTITADAGLSTAGASADILDKSLFAGDLGVVQSVAYLSALGRVYAAELTALSAPASTQIAADATVPAASRIYEVGPGVPQKEIASYNNENIVKILPFTGSDGTEYLILLDQTTGSIIRLNPVTKSSLELVTGLNQPSSMVFAPLSGDLLVVEKDRISTIPGTSLQEGLAAASGSAATSGAGLEQSLQDATDSSDSAGIAVDECTGKIYQSNTALGVVAEYDPITGLTRTVVSNLSQPGHLLGIYRYGVSCPDSFHLLIAEPGAGKIDLYVPSIDTLVSWLSLEGTQDLAFIPEGNPYVPFEGILTGSYTAEHNGQIHIVPLYRLYDYAPPNPPDSARPERRADVDLSQSSFPAAAAPGGTVVFTATVENKGPAGANDVYLLDKIPLNATLMSVTTDHGACQSADRIVQCDLGSLSAGDTATVRVQVAIAATAKPGEIDNVADVTIAEIDPDPANNHSVETTAVTLSSTTAFLIEGPSGSVIAGNSFSLKVTVIDAAGNVVTDYTGELRLSSTDPLASLPANYQFSSRDNGDHRFGSIILRSAGRQRITVSEVGNGFLSGILPITVSPATASSVHLEPPSGPLTAGVAATLTVSLSDPFGNAASVPGGYLHLSSSDPIATLPADVPMSAVEESGYRLSATLKKSGPQTITVKAIAGSPGPAILLSDTAGVTVLPASGSILTIVSETSTPRAGASFGITLTAKDPFGNIATGFRDVVHFSSTDTNPDTVMPADYAFSDSDKGVHSFDVRLTRAGRQTVSADSPGAHGALAVLVAAADASRFEVTFGCGTNCTAGVATSVRVKALDSFGNSATGYRGTIHFSSDDPKAQLPPDYTFGISDQGVHTFDGGLTFGICTCEASSTKMSNLLGGRPDVVIPPCTCEEKPTRTVTVTDTEDPSIQGSQTVDVLTPSADDVDVR